MIDRMHSLTEPQEHFLLGAFDQSPTEVCIFAMMTMASQTAHQLGARPLAKRGRLKPSDSALG